jgi:HEAT repeat protein
LPSADRQFEVVRDAVSLVIDLLRDGDPAVRADAAYTLGEMGEGVIRAALEVQVGGRVGALQMLQSPRAAERLMALVLLPEYGPYDVGPHAADPDPEIRLGVAVALARLGRRPPPQRSPLGEGVTDFPQLAAAVLSRLSERPTAPRWSPDQEPDEVRAGVLLLTDPRPEVRETAAYALGVLGAPQAVAGLQVALTDEAAGVRFRAVQALGMSRHG